MVKNNKRIVKAATWYTISNILIRAVSLITAPIFTRLLTPSDYGISSNFMTWTSIVFCITGLGLATSVIRGRVEFGQDFKRYLSAVQMLGFMFGLICMLAVYPQLGILSDLMELDKILVIIMFAYLLFYPSVGYAQISYRFEYRYKENILISVINAIGSVGCSVGLILIWTDQRYLGRIIGFLLPMFLMGIVFFIKISLKGKCFIDIRYWKYALKLSLPMIPHALSMIMLGQIDRVMILKYCGETNAGIYSFGYSYAVLTAMITNAVNDAVQPLIYDLMEQKKYTHVERLTNKMAQYAFLLSACVVAVGPEVLRILGTKEYFDARFIICPVVMGTLFQFLYQNYSLIEVYYKKTSIMAVGSVFAAGLNFLLNWFMLPRYGFVAAAYTTMISYWFLMIFHFIGARIVARRKIFQVDLLWIITGMACLCVFIFEVLYKRSIWLRYLCMLFIIASVWIINKEDWKKLSYSKPRDK